MTKHHINLLILAVVYLFILTGAYLYASVDKPAHECTTDSDCGCIDDCLEPMQDEAHPKPKQDRREPLPIAQPTFREEFDRTRLTHEDFVSPSWEQTNNFVETEHDRREE